MSRSEREKLLKKVQLLDCAMTETALYLDTHPRCTAALEYYRTLLAEKKKAQESYECQFGPLVQTSAAEGDKWTWIQCPWPWETEE